MILSRAALRPVPAFARVDNHAIEAVEQALEEGDEDLQAFLDQHYRQLELNQPALSEWLSAELASVRDELVQSLGYFLLVTVYMAFAETFSSRLTEIDAQGVVLAEQSLLVDQEVRANNPRRVVESDDIVAMDQPAVLAFVQHHVDEALSQSDDDIDLGDLERIYRAMLVEVISLSHAIATPSGHVGPLKENLA